ncbi:MAG: hypothetical protein KKF41_00190 [Actinobacteria bacterium]|nr:hypothetical protein [Actinomycetota bacterium]MBU2685986.1 hypothetical protein [Actinomycetota bacterium]
MTRARSIAVALILIATCMSLLPGCGGNTRLARQYCETGDTWYQKAVVLGRKLTDDEQQILKVMLANDVAGLVALKGQLTDMIGDVDESLGYLEKADDYYNKVLRLKDVPEYKQYAEIMREAVQKNKDSLTVGRQLANSVMGIIQSAESGVPVDLQAYVKSGSHTVNLLDQYVRTVIELETEARTYATQHDLF